MRKLIKISKAKLLILVCVGFALIIIIQNSQLTKERQNTEEVAVMTRTLTKSNIENASINTYLLPPHGNSQNTKDRDKHYSQVKQDEVVYEILQKKKGFFLEIGAHDGQYLSNTLWLEKQHKWTGLLIEGNPDRCKEIDKLKRNAWRLCACLSNSQTNISFIKDGDIGGIEDHLDEHHMKILDRKNKIFVPCFAIEHILNKISVHHIDFFSLNAEGGEMAVLKSMRSSLKYGMLTVDVWSIEYSVRDNHQTLVEKSKENLKFFRKYFDELGGYFEHSQLSTDDNTKDGYAVDVVFVRIGEWCKTKVKFPNGTDCPKKQKAYRIDDFLLHPFPFEKVKDADKRYSQAKQDQVAYDILKKQSGFFVDIGAHDGQFLSNTLWLERQHAWTGLLIEANPDLCKKIDKLKRHAWRLCACLSNTLGSVTFIKGDTVGGVESHIDEHHMKMVQKKDKITVPCYNLESVLDEIKTYHIDFFSLDVEGAEMAVLESLRDGLETNSFTVDLWSIEYRVWDGKQVVYEKSVENLNSLRWYFHSIGGYSEHSQLSNDENFSDGYALDVVFVRNKILCKNHKTLPNGMACSN